ncbi:hypothetical protein U9M48_041730 [Paspalum notatum var. saurae]|uniref:Uncharacterized protein n=2 Tax=Paspalum notatum var. saurae TaxID=547442 RepID=A0AAQ3XEH6_PASNO
MMLVTLEFSRTKYLSCWNSPFLKALKNTGRASLATGGTVICCGLESGFGNNGDGQRPKAILQASNCLKQTTEILEQLYLAADVLEIQDGTENLVVTIVFIPVLARNIEHNIIVEAYKGIMYRFPLRVAIFFGILGAGRGGEDHCASCCLAELGLELAQDVVENVLGSWQSAPVPVHCRDVNKDGRLAEMVLRHGRSFTHGGAGLRARCHDGDRRRSPLPACVVVVVDPRDELRLEIVVNGVRLHR